MKKLLLGACIVFGALFSANAQLPYLQNFETSMTATPAGWGVGVASHHTKNPGWTFNNAYPTAGNSYWQGNTATHTYCAFVDDVDYNYTGSSWNNTTGTVDYDTLYTGVFSCAAATHVFISLDFNYNNYTNYEVGTIAVSTNGGLTWTTAVTLPILSGDLTWYNGQIYDLTAFAAGQANVKVAFCWNNLGAVTNYTAPGWGMAVDNINIYAPQDYDLSVASQTLPYLMQVGTPYKFTGTISNYGGTAITSMNMNYSVNGGPVQTQTISGISGFNALTNYSWSMNTTPYTPSAAGNITVKYWADHLNGSNVDANNANDTLVGHFMVVNNIQTKQVMYEEFSCASCNPCMYAMPNIDSVANNSVAYANNIRYHWYFPGQDMINLETATLVNNRMSYYGQNGVPTSAIDGTIWYPGAGYLSSGVIQQAAAIGSPFKIDINTATYNTTTKKYNFSAVITSYGTFPANLKAQVYLTEDSVDFKTDQSTEDPLSSFPGTNPWYYYDFLLNFPNAVEEALPSAAGAGQNLTAFTPASTQTVTVSWTKSHPWAAKYSSYNYDSSATQHFTIFIQDNSGNPAAGVPAQYVYQSAKALVTVATGMDEISNGVSFEMYPNPSTGNTTVAFNLAKSENVTIDVYNMLGEKVYTSNQGKVESGDHTVSIDGQDLNSGVYFVKFVTDNTTTTQKLVIQK